MPYGPLFKTCCRKAQSKSFIPQKVWDFTAVSSRQLLEAGHRLEFTKQNPSHPKVQDGDPRVHTCLPQERGMSHIYRSHRRLLTRANSHPVSKIPQVSFQRRHLPVHQPPLRASNSPPHFHQYSQRGKTDSFAIRNQTPPIPGRLVDPCPLKTTIHCSNTKTTKAGEGFGLYSKPQEVRTQTISEVRLPGLSLFTRFGSCEAHARQVDQTSEDVPSPLLEVCYQCKDSAMSTIGLLASTEKTVKLGRMHIRPFQWHLKTDWNQKMIRHGEWWLDPQNVLQGEHLHPKEHKKLIFTDTSNAGLGAHSSQNSTGGLVSLSEKHLHINLLEMKAVLLALQFFKTDCRNNQVLIASDNTSMVAYINKQGSTKSAELCALMWRILTWCHLNNVTLRARYVPGSLNVIADGLSRRNQIQSTEWSLSPQIFKQIFKQISKFPQVDLFATSLNKKLPTYVSPIPDPQAWAVDALNIPWENMVAHAFPPIALLPKVVQKLQSQTCRIILIAPDWPTKPWFWDLVEMSLDIPRQLPPTRTLLKQPLNNQYHANPTSLNLHVWYLGVQHSKNRVSLQKWQKELLLLRDSQQDPSTHPSGPFSNVGAQKNRWTSGVPL